MWKWPTKHCGLLSVLDSSLAESLLPLSLSLSLTPVPLWLPTNWVENMNENIPPLHLPKPCSRHKHTTPSLLSTPSLSLHCPPTFLFLLLLLWASSLLFNIVCTFLRTGLKERSLGGVSFGFFLFFFFLFFCYCLWRNCGSLERGEGTQTG